VRKRALTLLGGVSHQARLITSLGGYPARASHRQPLLPWRRPPPDVQAGDAGSARGEILQQGRLRFHARGHLTGCRRRGGAQGGHRGGWGEATGRHGSRGPAIKERMMHAWLMSSPSYFGTFSSPMIERNRYVSEGGFDLPCRVDQRRRWNEGKISQ
jgi:hypothetical protein